MHIIDRKTWGARKPKKVLPSLLTPALQGVVIHHSATGEASVTMDAKSEQAKLRGIQRFHMEDRGWSDVAYNYIIFPSGRVYEGRGQRRSGANGNGTWNKQYVAICFYGDYTRKPPTPQAAKAAEDLYHELKKTWKGRKLDKVIGHGDLKSTGCPGAGLKALVDKLDDDACCEGPVVVPVQPAAFPNMTGARVTEFNTPEKYRKYLLADGSTVTWWKEF